MGTAHWYAVYTRDVLMYSGGGYEPDEWGAFFVYAKAKTARRAKVIALRWFRRHEGWQFKSEIDRDYGSPFTGMKADLIPTEDVEVLKEWQL